MKKLNLRQLNFDLIKFIISFSSLFALQNIAGLISGFFGIVILSQLGPDYLAAGPLTMMAKYWVVFPLAGFFRYTSLKMMHARANKNSTLINAYFKNGLILMVLLTILLCISLKIIFNLFFTLNPSIIHAKIITLDYLKIFYFTAFLMSLNIALNNYLIVIKKTSLSVKINVLKSIVFLILCYVLIHKYFGKEWGILGYAYAEIMTESLMLIYKSMYIFKYNKLHLSLNLFRQNINKKLLTEQIKYGQTFLYRSFATLFNIFVTTALCFKLGQEMLETIEVGNEYFMIFFFTLIAITASSSIKLAHLYGKKDFKKIKEYALYNTAYTVIVCTIVLLFIFFFKESLVEIFIKSHNYINVHLIHFMIIGLMFVGVRIFFTLMAANYAGYLSAISDFHFSMYVDVFTRVVIPLIILFILCFMSYNIFWIFFMGIILSCFQFILLCGRWKYLTQKY